MEIGAAIVQIEHELMIHIEDEPKQRPTPRPTVPKIFSAKEVQ